MITGTLFHTLAFPWLFLNPGGGIVDRGRGTLFTYPSHLNEDEVVRFCRGARPGVIPDPAGGAICIREVPDGRGYRLAVYGLKIRGISMRQGKSDVLSIKLTVSQIQGYLDQFLAAAERTSAVVSDLIVSSVHELRNINTDVRHASEEIISQEFSDEIDLGGIIRRAKNINALSDILSRRTDFLDYVANPRILQVKRRRIRPYQKFDKVKRSLESRANHRYVNLRLEGTSLGSIDALMSFEIVPYLLIQNAVKYSPNGGDVVIGARDEPDSVVFTVRNLGPKLEPEEIESIFEQGFRGRRSKEAGISGSGFGLYFLRELVQVHHGGSIGFLQDGVSRHIGGIEYLMTSVQVRLPRAEEEGATYARFR